MFCTNCGKKISASEIRCPLCGAEQAKLQGGSSFFDLAQGIQKSTSNLQNDDQKRIACSNPQCIRFSEQVESLRKQNKLPAIIAMIALIVGVIGLISTVAIKKNADDWMAGYDNNIRNFTIAAEDDRSRITELENKKLEMELIVDAMQTELEQMKTAMATPSPEETAPDVTDEVEITAFEEVVDEYTEENDAQDMMIPGGNVDKTDGIDTFEPEHPLSDIFGN